MRYVNNLDYNQGYKMSSFYGPTSIDIIGNKYVAGPDTPSLYEIELYNGSGTYPTFTGTPSAYLSANMGMHVPNSTDTQWNMVSQVTSYQGTQIFPAPSSWQRFTPLAAQTFPIIADDVNNLDNVLFRSVNGVGDSQKLNDAACDGTFLQNYDAVDNRIIAQYKTNTGAYISDPSQVGGWPTLAAGTPCTSTLHDGIADAWKVKYGLSTTNATLYQTTDPVSGYTYLEDYLNGIAPNLTARTNSTTSLWAASLAPKAKMDRSNTEPPAVVKRTASQIAAGR